MSELTLFTAQQAQRRVASKHGVQIAAIAPLMRSLAFKAGRLGVTVGDLRCHGMRLGALPVMGKGRELSWLSAVPRAAGLVATEKRRMCDLPDSRNDHRVWLHPDFA